MKVFISWSGERSRLLAQGLRDWIPLVLHYVEPWLSEVDIDAGERWADAVAKELEASNFGIISVTRENVASPWVLFEAGALAKLLQGSRVIPLLLDLEFREITGPLAQFQAKKADKAGLGEVIHSINQASGHPIPDARIKQLFDPLWPEFEKQLSALPKLASPPKHSRPQTEILEELVSSVRALDARFRDIPSEPPRPRHRRWRHSSMFVHELGHAIAEGPGDPLIILLVSSMFREDLPWLYELGVEAYRAARRGPRPEAERALRRFRHAAEMTLRGPFPVEELGLDPRTFHGMWRDLEHLLFRERVPPEEPPAKARKKKEGVADEEPG